MAELEWTSASFRHPSSCFPLDLFVYVKQIQKQKYGSQPSRFLVYGFPKIRPELIWGEQSGQRSMTGIKRGKGQRETERRGEEKIKNGGGGVERYYDQHLKQNYKTPSAFGQSSAKFPTPAGWANMTVLPPSLKAAVPGCITSPGT